MLLLSFDLHLTLYIVLTFLGVGAYDKVAIISNNRWEWATIATAAFSMKATIVPMYEAQLPNDWTYILNDSGASAVFCATQDIYDRVQREVLPSTPAVNAALCLDAAEGEPHAFATAMSAVGLGDQDGMLISPPTPEDLADLIYTSGTTGQPKGREKVFVYRNIISQASYPMCPDSHVELIFQVWS
jgi:long-chain acyl-CoA synthetase